MSKLTDIFTTVDAGMNSGLAPLLLEKNQAAMMTNAAVRGGHITNRPPFQQCAILYSDPLDKATFETGLFQGAAYYRPDFGIEFLVAQISGQLFKVAPTGATWQVTNISIPGDFNSATATQCWMWQAEKWLIVSDGTGALPIFFDGVSSRRSVGPSVLLGTVSGSGWSVSAPPAIGDTVTLTLTAPYTGAYNKTVLFNGEYYETTQFAPSVATYKIKLTNLFASKGGTVPAGTNLMIMPSLTGKVTSTSAVSYTVTGSVTDPRSGATSGNITYYATIGIELGSNTVYAEQKLTLGSDIWTVTGTPTQTSATQVSVLLRKHGGTTAAPTPDPQTPSVGQIVTYSGSTAANVVVAVTETDFISPSTDDQSSSVPGIVTVDVDRAVSLTAGQTVWIGNNEYAIAGSSPTTPSPTYSLILINLTDTSASQYASPAASQVLSIPELPAGRMGCYGMGQVWMSLVDGISFIGGDIVGGGSGNASLNYRDAVLKTTANTFQLGGGAFQIPNGGETINAMWFVALLDNALGQGPLQVSTDSTIFACNATGDRAAWVTMTNPILTESLIGSGALSQNSTVLAGSDTFFRSREGVGSLIIARREITAGWGNTTVSSEMDRILSQDALDLLAYSSAIVFNNRLVMTASPHTSGSGTYHRGLVSMDFDPVSNLRQKLPPVYDGLWTGINTLQLLQGRINGIQRAFAFTFNFTTGTIQLYELFRSGTAPFDNGGIPILTTMETPILFNKDIKPLTDLIRLDDGEIYVQDVYGVAGIEIQYRPDFYPGWTTWRKFSVCSQSVFALKDSETPAPPAPVVPASGKNLTLNCLPGNCTYGIPYYFGFTAQGGTTPYTFTVTKGSLPAGLSLSVTGSIVGTPKQKGTYQFTVNVVDYSIPQQSLNVDCTVTIAPMLITIKADDKSKILTCLTTEPTLTYTITQGHVVIGDTLNGSLQRASGETNGTYAITQLIPFSINSNYSITFISGVFTISTAANIFNSTPFNWNVQTINHITATTSASGANFSINANGVGGDTQHGLFGSASIAGHMTCPDNRLCRLVFTYGNVDNVRHDGYSHFQLSMTMGGTSIVGVAYAGSVNAPNNTNSNGNLVPGTYYVDIQFVSGQQLAIGLTLTCDTTAGDTTFTGCMYEVTI